jgi:thioredoxin-like negative regulator of GroEL
MSASSSMIGGLDRKTFFVGLLLAVAVMIAGTFIVTRMMQDRGGDLRASQPARPMPPPAMKLVKSPHITDVETDIEGVNALATGGAPKVVLVHAPWCGHCRNMMPAFVEAAAAERGVTWVRVDGNVAPSIVRREDLRGFPTVYGVMRDGSITQHDGGRDVRSLIEFARTVAAAGAAAAAVPAPANVSFAPSEVDAPAAVEAPPSVAFAVSTDESM